MVYTGGESPQDRLRDIWTYRMILALAYVLYYLSAAWLKLEIRGISLRWVCCYWIPEIKFNKNYLCWLSD